MTRLAHGLHPGLARILVLFAAGHHLNQRNYVTASSGVFLTPPRDGRTCANARFVPMPSGAATERFQGPDSLYVLPKPQNPVVRIGVPNLRRHHHNHGIP